MKTFSIIIDINTIKLFNVDWSVDDYAEAYDTQNAEMLSRIGEDINRGLRAMSRDEIKSLREYSEKHKNGHVEDEA